MRIHKKTLLVFFLILLSTAIIRIKASDSLDNNISLNYITHDPIFIISDDNFTDYGFPGNGTAEDPYLIENYYINNSTGISIQSTTQHFIIRNCFLESVSLGYIGIIIHRVAPHTAFIYNNTCTGFSSLGGAGIQITYSTGVNITDNLCKENFWGDINISDSNEIRVVNNVLENEVIVQYDMYITNVTDCLISNNLCTGVAANSLSISGSRNIIIDNNTLFRTHSCITLSDTSDCVISNNIIYKSSNYGILCYGDSLFTNISITNNLLQENEMGVILGTRSRNSTISYNTFIDNHPEGDSKQAKDSGSNNTWYDIYALKGNFWSDWDGSGPYSIDGDANSFDLYPLSNPTIPPLIPEFNSKISIIIIFSVVIYFVWIYKKSKRSD